MKDNHVAVILEDINHKFDVVFEIAGDIMALKQDLGGLKADVHELKLDMKTVKAAVQATNHQVTDHENRLTMLKAT